MNSKDLFALDTLTMKRHLTSQNMKQYLRALRSIGINETYIIILEDTYTGATARVHMDNQGSENIPMIRGVRQGDPISPKLFTATNQGVFKCAQLEGKGINIDGEKLSNVRLADNVALTTEDVKDMGHHLNTVNEESLKTGLKIHKVGVRLAVVVSLVGCPFRILIITTGKQDLFLSKFMLHLRLSRLQFILNKSICTCDNIGLRKCEQQQCRHLSLWAFFFSLVCSAACEEYLRGGFTHWYLLPRRDRSCKPNLLTQPVTEY